MNEGRRMVRVSNEWCSNESPPVDEAGPPLLLVLRRGGGEGGDAAPPLTGRGGPCLRAVREGLAALLGHVPLVHLSAPARLRPALRPRPDCREDSASSPTPARSAPVHSRAGDTHTHIYVQLTRTAWQDEGYIWTRSYLFYLISNFCLSSICVA